MNIQVETTQLLDKSNDIRLVKDNLAEIMEQIEQLILSVEGDWQGDAERTFSSKIVFVKKQFSNILSFFESYSYLLVSFADSYEQIEDTISSKINQA